MSFIESFRMAMTSILSSKTRSILTMLGIIIGVAAVIVITGLGNGMEIYMTESFQSMGTNLLTVSVSGRGTARKASVDDMFAILDENPELFYGMSPTVNVMGSVKIGTETMSYTSVTGIGEDYDDINSLTVEQGRFIEYVDNLKYTRSCVVGSYINNEYFLGNALGQTLKINGEVFQIVGVMEEVADSEEQSSDDAVFIPYSTATKINASSNISSYSFAMITEDRITESKAAITGRLTEIYGNSDAFNIMSLAEILDMMTEMINIMITILTAIAAISLVVGGIGIMNIMLVSVSERTREIGIRKALGAKKRNIMSQFIIEAGTTSALGGILGILFGYLLSSAGTTLIVTALEADMAITPSFSSVMMSFGISAGIGVVFGYLPARRASRLLPIDALRYD